MSKESAICPQCGAQGIAGEVCEFCGTRIPLPVIEEAQEEEAQEEEPFSWYNVIPQGYDPSVENIIGDPANALYMVVKRTFSKNKATGSGNEVQDYYGVINRKGKFVVDCDKENIEFYQETNYHLYKSKGESVLQNLETGNTVAKGNIKTTVFQYVKETTLVGITNTEKKTFSLFDMNTNRFIRLPFILSDLGTEYDCCSMYCSSKDGLLKFTKHEYNIYNYAKKDTKWDGKIEEGRVVVQTKDDPKNTKKPSKDKDKSVTKTPEKPAAPAQKSTKKSWKKILFKILLGFLSFLGILFVILIICVTIDSESNDYELDDSDMPTGTCDTPDGHYWVDLGLPSGTKWATCNIGASKPEEYGEYLRINDKSAYNIDTPSFLDTEDDAAFMSWGEDWRMPSESQLQELIEQCDWNSATLNGVDGCLVESKSNNNSIFLPYAGVIDTHEDTVSCKNVKGFYRSRTLQPNEEASYLVGSSEGVHTFTASRYAGVPVRPVRLPN